jgi:TonB family protein
MNSKSQSAQLITPSVLEGKAISKPAPAYPWLAAVLEISGNVQVDVVIDELGTVTVAEAVSGPLLLKRVAVEAARKARFTPTLLSGQPVKVKGVITYHFSPNDPSEDS